MKEKSPLDIACPDCKASITAKCTFTVKDGFKYKDSFCKARVLKFENLLETNKKDHGFPEAVENFFRNYFK